MLEWELGGDCGEETKGGIAASVRTLSVSVSCEGRRVCDLAVFLATK